MSGKKKKHGTAYTADILRTIQKGKRRFFSLLLITVLGVTMFSGLQAACMDLRYSADCFFDAQKLHDLEVLSTMGLTEADLESIEEIKGVESAEMAWSLEADTEIAEDSVLLEYRSFSEEGLDVPYVTEGALPTETTDAAITKKTAEEYHLSIGDTLVAAPETGGESIQASGSTTVDTGSSVVQDATIQNEAIGENEGQDEPYLELQQKEFTITGIVIDAADINNPFGSVSYRTDSSKADTVFVLPDAFEGNYGTSIRIRVEKAEDDLCYTSGYEDRITDVKNRITDEIKEEREKARTDQMIAQAQRKLAELQAVAPQELAEAQLEIGEVQEAVWYLQDRGSISGYANLESDADSIEAIGTAFPVVFFIVAILISLTTITRMIEEERSLIGTYKSLGFTDGEIRRKYLVYAGAAGVTGSAIGTLCAFVALPAFIFRVFDVMYLLPGYSFHWIMTYGILGPAIFTFGILAAAGYVVRKELKQVPASLMRPVAPKAGSRILLERITPLWKSLLFLKKVTARNLFRYKKRLFMTIFGIAGCTALMLFGFAIRDSVEDLSPRQYEQTFVFDVMAVADTGNTGPMFSFLQDHTLVEDSIELYVTSAELKNDEGKSTSVTMMVVPSGAELSEYISLQNKESGALKLQDEAVYVTRNAANVLGLGAGDRAELKLADLQNARLSLTELTENYLGNYLYMTENTYLTYFEDFSFNAALAHLNGSKSQQITCSDELKDVDGVLSVTGVAELESQFSGAFMLINMVVAIVILMSAALAFVVLFTLASTNISERARELATIKVLGFFDPEVHSYINRETLILTGIGIVLGMPLGRLFAESLTVILNLPSIYLAVSLKPRSYVYAVLLNVIFAWIVNVVISRTMDRIDPVEALKSVE